MTDDNASSHAEPKEVLFYILNSTELNELDAFVCKLVNKIYQQGRRCDLRFADQQQAQRFELTLWNWRADSFIPHSLERQISAPIQLYADHIDQPCQDVLINLHPNFCEQHQAYQRTIEVVDQSDFLIQKGRQRWRDYQSRQLEPIVHKIGFN
ncbi:DNA polymerase III subunit chi [Thiosulfatimonas sediminis]|uniref:DNA polymerase III subunit chi n=1 Tax=Thiosulfatimonas sediminis TaxID=2675054 RepID=A0A6F8PT59_9GAMM|nr:DNA polymerase III subunit chi [Thiosulfatimonas sediminis]BBP45214.1 DNA polymerase III subunit chi [Thiosulfatimonas sediminis]